MTNFKNIVATITLAVIIASSATFANAGILLGDATQPSCTQTQDTKGTERVNSGILIGDLTGIVIFGFTGIVIFGAAPDQGPVNCGIVIFG
jgi:hypothetical protein